MRLKVHWDHIGEPRDFDRSTFVVGPGAPNLLVDSSALRGGHSFFEADLLPMGQTIELTDPIQNSGSTTKSSPGEADFTRSWAPNGDLPHTLDVFGDGSLYIVHAPGHLPGHINLLCRVGPQASIYLAGDACHDRRILRKEKAIGEWKDAEGQVCCIHADRPQAEKTIEMIGRLEKQGVEVIFAHDVEWEQDLKNKDRYFGAR